MNIANIRGDLFGGATAAVVALPLALAFGVASGAGALAGLYGAILAGFFAAIFGGTSAQVTGPTGPMTVVMALIVTQFHANLAVAFTIVMLSGCVQVLFGKLGLGRYIKLVPQPVVSGFMSGIGFIIIIVQIAPLLGRENVHGSVLVKLSALPTLFAEANVEALALGLAVLAILFVMPRRAAALVPPPLTALVIGTLAAMFFVHGVPTIGPVPSGLPTLIVPQISVEDLPVIIRFTLILAFLGSIDSLLTSIVADSITRTAHNSNRELIGQGIGNIAAGLFGAIPGAGATMRTLINVRSGGSTRLSGVFHSLLLLGILLGFGGAVSHIPLTVLAGILLKVGIDIVDWDYLRRIRHAPPAGVVIMLTTLTMTVFVDLITAVAVGFVMASVLFVARMADAQVKTAKFAYGADQIADLTATEEAILSAAAGRIVLFHVEGPLSFGSARDIARMLQSDVDKDVLAIDLRHVPFIDSSASAALDEVVEQLKADGDEVVLFGANSRVLDVLRRTGLLERIGADHVLERRIDALEFARAFIETGSLATSSER